MIAFQYHRLVSLPGFNPGVVATLSGLLAISRVDDLPHPTPPTRTIPVLSDLTSAPVVNLDVVGYSADTRLEDFRPFLWRADVWVSHTIVRPDQITLGLSKLVADQLVRADDWHLPRILAPVEKNWVCLIQGGMLYTVYRLSPFTLYHRNENGWAFTNLGAGSIGHSHRWEKSLGHAPSNSCHLLPFDSGYLGWWHLRLDGEYLHGAYYLDGDLRLAARTGILFGSDWVTAGHKPGVCYVTSQIHHPGEAGGVIDLYCGEADQWCGVVRVSMADVRSRLRSW